MSRRSVTRLPAKKVKNPQRLVVMNPSKGLNNLVSPSLIDNREFSDLLNVEYDEGGVIRKRYGYTAVADTLVNARGLGIFASETQRQLVTISQVGSNYSLRYRTTGSWQTATGAITFTPDRDTTFTQARNKLFVWNGADGGSVFDGATVARPGTMPKAKFSVYFNGYHISAGVEGQPSRLYVSNLSDASDFTVAAGGTQPQADSTTDSENGITNVPGATVFAGTPSISEARVFDIRKNDGDKITGLGVYQEVLIIFKERSIFQFTFDSGGLGTVTPITYATGCVSHKSIKAVENDLYFMSREGLRVLGNEPQYFTAIRTQVLSIRIQPTLDSINKSQYARMNGQYFDNKYILCYPTGSSTKINQAITYDRRFQAFTVWSNFNAQDMVRFIDNNNEESLYFLDDSGTQMYVRQAGLYNDNGAAIEAYVISKAQELGNPDITKFWIDIRLIFRRLAGQVQLTVYQDDAVTVGTAVLGSGGNRGAGLKALGRVILGLDGQRSTTTVSTSDIPQSLSLNIDSRTIKYKIYNNRVNESFVLLGMVYNAYPKSPFVFNSSNRVYF